MLKRAGDCAECCISVRVVGTAELRCPDTWMLNKLMMLLKLC